MRLLLAIILSCLLGTQAVAEHNRLTPEQVAAGWISLFDGETLFGWQPTSDADWRVENGVIRVSAGKPGFLMTTSQFADYELDIEFRCKAETNSGIFLRSLMEPKNPATDCLELNIAPKSNAFPTGSFVGQDKQERHPIPYTVKDAKGKEFSVDPWDGRWHRIQVKAWSDGTWTIEQGYKSEWYGAVVAIDKFPTSMVAGAQPAAGHIGLQFQEGEIEFRNIRLRPKGLKPIFNGKDLTGWNTDRADASRFQVVPNNFPHLGELRVLDGRGQIESDTSYGDFVLQLECFVDGDALNSGVFFRCIPGDFMMGYECQIHNGMKDNDPTLPADCGTGGFFRRQNARRVVAKDREWFAMTLVADGPHMAAWVDGQQVSDWTDTRKPHENPRKGLRLEPGTLAIQGHDPTTDLRFRKLRIVELPEEK